MTLFKVVEYKVSELFNTQLDTDGSNMLIPTDETIFKTEAAALDYLHNLYHKDDNHYDRWYGQGCWEINQEDDNMVTFTTTDNGLMFTAVIVTVHDHRIKDM